jgi:hypothetical protein
VDYQLPFETDKCIPHVNEDDVRYILDVATALGRVQRPHKVFDAEHRPVSAHLIFFLTKYSFENAPWTWANQAAKVPPPHGDNLKLVSLAVGLAVGCEAINVTLIKGYLGIANRLD